MFKEAFPDQNSYKQEHLVQSTWNKHMMHTMLLVMKLHCWIYEKAPATAKSNEKYQFTVKSVQDSIASTENKRKHLAGCRFLIEDKKFLSTWLTSYLVKEYQLKHCEQLQMIKVLMDLIHC